MRRNYRSNGEPQVVESSRDADVWETIKTLVSGGADASRLLELYYWSREPGVVELIRRYLEMPEPARRMLGEYLLNARPRSIVATSDPAGRLVLAQADSHPMERRAHQ